jgi:hypothetical protein
MTTPPNDIPANVLWEQITSLPRPSRIVDFPKTDPVTGKPVAQVLMQILTQGELIAAAAETETNTKKLLKETQIKRDDQSLGYENVYANESSIQVLFRACKRPGASQWPFFPSPTAMRDKLTQDEVAVLMREYLIVQGELGPIVASMDQGDVDAWVARLGEGGSAFPLALLSSDGVNSLVMHMVSRLYTSPTDTSLPGSQPENSTPSLKAS